MRWFAWKLHWVSSKVLFAIYASREKVPFLDESIKAAFLSFNQSIVWSSRDCHSASEVLDDIVECILFPLPAVRQTLHLSEEQSTVLTHHNAHFNSVCLQPCFLSYVSSRLPHPQWRYSLLGRLFQHHDSNYSLQFWLLLMSTQTMFQLRGIQATTTTQDESSIRGSSVPLFFCQQVHSNLRALPSNAQPYSHIWCMEIGNRR